MTQMTQALSMLSVLGWRQDVCIDWWVSGATIVGAMGAAVVGALVPARVATRMAPARTLRFE